MTGVLHDPLDHDDRGRTLTPAASMDTPRAEGISPGRRSWRETDETYSQASQSPEASRRKRLSFFARSNSDASRRSLSTARSAVSHQNPPIAETMKPLPELRPSSQQSNSRRRAGDAFENIRNSLFRSRKTANAAGQMNTSRPSSRQSQSTNSRPSQLTDLSAVNTNLIPFAQGATSPGIDKEKPKPGQFKTEKEYYQHRKKSSISPPFNFQHVTHTAKKHLPKLDTVDEKDLPAQFWAVNAYQRPKHKLNGIKADALDRHRARGRSESNTRPTTSKSSSDHAASFSSHTVTRSVDETTFDETIETSFNADEAYRLWEDVDASASKAPRPPPKHYSSMSALSGPSSLQGTPVLRGQQSFDDRNARSPSQAAMHATRSSLPAEPPPVPEKEFENGAVLSSPHELPQGQKAKEKQPLPPLPQQLLDKDWRASSSEPRFSFSLFPPPPKMKSEMATSIKSKRSSRSAATISSVKSVSSRRTDILEEPTWEDDIDFAYEQEAEGRCDFNWETTSSPLIEEDETQVTSEGSGTDSAGGGVRLSAWFAHPRANRSKSSLSNLCSSADFGSAADEASQHKRGSSVGHKGFAAARNASHDGSAKNSPSMSLDMVCGPAGTPPPKISLAGADVEQRSYPSVALHFPTFDTINEYLSDPESTAPGGTRHRKSSSFGSYDSSGRSLQTASDIARWSSASTSSIPDLLYSKRKSRSSLGKSRMSRPLESVPHSPEQEPLGQDEHNLGVRRPAIAAQPETDSIMLRRPETPGDRELLFSAGRTVQRGRSATPNRLQARLSPQSSQEGGWI